MAIHFENLDETTRSHMIVESQLGNHYESPRLTPSGLAEWQNLLETALQSHDDDWLSGQLLSLGYIRTEENYTRSGVTRTRNINQPSAALQLAEGEFNRYYLRGLCQRAKSTGIDHLIVYRGKAVENPRPESEARIGTSVNVDELLAALRVNDFVNIGAAMGVPGGPNSGISAKLPDVA